MSEMIERVGGTIVESLRQIVEGEFDGYVTEEIRRYLDDPVLAALLGRAAIAAMREPTLDMVLIGHNAEPLPSMRARPIHYKHAWQAMIDEALR